MSHDVGRCWLYDVKQRRKDTELYKEYADNAVIHYTDTKETLKE